MQINTAWLLVSDPFELVCEAWKSVTGMLALQILLRHHTLYWQCTSSEAKRNNTVQIYYFIGLEVG